MQHELDGEKNNFYTPPPYIELIQGEVWVDLFGTCDKYKISNMGRIISIFKYKKFDGIEPRQDRIKLLSLNTSPNQYYSVLLTLNGIKKDFRVSRIVAETFIPNPENKSDVNHKNGNKHDNRVSNLEWCTRGENIKHAYDTGLKKPTVGNKNKGFSHQCNKAVVQMSLSGEYMGEYFSATFASKELGVSNLGISMCCHNINKSCGGYKWKFKTK